MSESPLELTVLMPCLNEAETIAPCVGKALRWLAVSGVLGEVVVADNGSTDGSRELAAGAGARVVHVEPRGYGAALAGGIAAARGRFVIMGDADDSYDFSRLEDFLANLRSGKQLVIGNRFAGGIDPGAMRPLHRYVGNPVLSFVGRLFFASPFGDFHCGLRGFEREAIIELDLHTTGMEFASEMIVKATLANLRLAEVPTALRPAGRSRPPHLRTWRDGWRHLRFLLIYCPRWLFLLPGLTLVSAGVVGFAVFLPGTPHLGRGAIGIPMLLGAGALIVIGFQAIVFAALTKVFAITEGLLPEDRHLSQAFRFVTLETGLAVGALQVGLGLAGALCAAWEWRERGGGSPEAGGAMRVFIPAMVLGITGSQTILASFFLSILGLRRK